jgi:Spy/CpxP family protein refolding chaperone
MKSRIALVTLLGATLTAGALLADVTPLHRQGARANVLDRMSSALNLTDQQRQQARAIFDSERAAARSVRVQLRQDRKALQAAIQAGKPAAEVQQIARAEGPVLGNLAAMRADAFAKFYAVLTPAQQQKLASLHQELRQRREARQSGAAAQR